MKEIQTKRIKNKNLSNDQPYLKENEIGLLEMKNIVMEMKISMI